MKIMTVMGSPRPHGNTAAVLGLFESLAAAAHQVDRIDVVKHEVKGCLGCDTCHKTLSAPGCVQRDDAVGLFERLMTADVIVYATPLYVWDFPAQMKAFLDRHYCLVKWAGGTVAARLLEGKRAALLVTCGDAAEGNADLIQEIFERQMRFVGCRVLGKYVVPNCSAPDQLGEKGRNVAREMYEEICGEVPCASDLAGPAGPRWASALRMDYYEIAVHGHLDARRAESFEGLEMTLLPDGGTLIAGPLRDQAELHAMLSRIRDMGITLVSVRLIKRSPHLPM